MRSEPGERLGVPEHRLLHERIPIDREIERQPGTLVRERHPFRVAVDDAGDDTYRVARDEIGMFRVLDARRVGGRHLGHDVDLALGRADQVKRRARHRSLRKTTSWRCGPRDRSQ